MRFRLRCVVTIIIAISASHASEALAVQDAQELLRQAAEAAGKTDSARAVELATAAIAKSPELADAYYLRGREQFRLGKIAESVADFDKYVQLRPALEPRQWERGIAYYYAGKYEAGAAQFALYQTYHDNDVENSVWRFLCMVPDSGVERARAVMLPIKNDRRVPMMQVYDLYRGNLEPADVLAAVPQGDPPPATLAARGFYAHLYLGLYYDVLGDEKLARKYIELAAAPELGENPGINRYMWDVARVHARQMQQRGAETGESSPRP